MASKQPPFSARLKVVILATWLLLHALGSAGLHTILECGHDEAAETFAHQETATAHWAGLKSAPVAAADCPACTLASQAADLPETWLAGFESTTNESSKIEPLLFLAFHSWEQSQPRAPPVA
jgi:hypothetical protein